MDMVIVWVAGCCIMGVVAGALTLHNVNGIRDRGIPDKIKEFKGEFKRAKQYIHIQTDLNRKFFNDPAIIQAFEEASRNKAEIKILVDPEGEKLENVPRLKELVEKGLVDVKVAKKPFKETATPHCFVIDGRAVRIEAYHEPLEEKIEGVFYRNYPRLANAVEAMFGKLWEAN